MKERRDSMRSKLYAAEQPFIDLCPKFTSWAEVVAFGTKVASCKFATDLNPDLKRGVTFRGVAGNSARYHQRLIGLSHYGWNAGVIIHEVAHLCVNPRLHEGHGREFRRVYYQLAYLFAPAGYYKILRLDFGRYGLSYSAVRPKRKLTVKEKQALTSRLLASKVTK
jgi:hypothetical protein